MKEIRVGLIVAMIVVICTRNSEVESSTLTTRICDGRQLLELIRKACTFYGKRQKQSSIFFQHGLLRFQRSAINEMILPPPELQKKCCDHGCNVELLTTQCNLA